jgi:hypothetical protein
MLYRLLARYARKDHIAEGLIRMEILKQAALFWLGMLLLR